MRSLILLTLLCSFALGPLFAPGYFWGAHDARHSVYFLFEFNRALNDGVWYPRWMPDFAFGFGYPFFNINSPLAYYSGAGLLRIGCDYVTATKIVFGFAIIASGWAMYGFVRRWLNEQAALVAALVYVYAPYHLLDVYVRGALAETVALVFMPLCLGGFAAAIERPRSATVVGAALAYAGLLFAHSGIALLFSLLLGAYLLLLVIVKTHREQPLNHLRYALFSLWAHLIHVSTAPLLALLLGIGLSGIFIAPSLLENSFVRTDQYTTGTRERLDYYNYRNHFSYFFQLVSPAWGFGLSQPGPRDDISLQLGAAASVLALCSVFVVAQRPRQPWRASLIFFQLATVVIIFLMLPQSLMVWERIPLVAWVQFPWRLLALTALTMAPLAGSVMYQVSNVSSVGEHPMANDQQPTLNNQLLITHYPFSLLLIILLILLSSYPYTTAEIIEATEGEVSFAGLMKFQHDAGELTGSTAWVKTIPTWSPLAEVYLNNEAPTTQVDYANLPAGVVVDSRGHSSIHDEIWFRAEQDSYIIFNRFFYPGWRAYLLEGEHGKPTQRLTIEPRGEFGLITVYVPRGEHFMVLRFEDTPPRLLGAWLTVLSVSSVGVWALVKGGRQFVKR
jgi:hypothetical protein